MQEKIIQYFKLITKIPHCSQKTDKLLEFLENFATERGYKVEIDETKNILIKKGEPQLALQAHYDMVCIGDAPNINIYIKDGWMYAKNSSLGADNGIAIAMMMVLMDRGEELEFLITSDEEIGLIGATALNFELKSKYMLNLDFEDEAEVCIGCAGGADILANQKFKSIDSSYTNYYKVSVLGLEGGHSGVDIDKNIPNAIKVLAKYLSQYSIEVNSIKGGEIRNSIPIEAEALISSIDELESNDMIKVEKLENKFAVWDCKNLIILLNQFQHGVHSYNSKFNLPESSINLAIVEFNNGYAKIETSVRAMSMNSLNEISKKTITLFSKLNFETQKQYKYPAWRPNINNFTKIVGDSMQNIFGKNEYKAIHAGLECGLISEKYPFIEFASIGPTILYPHSTREKIKVDSIGKTFEVVEDVINKIK